MYLQTCQLILKQLLKNTTKESFFKKILSEENQLNLPKNWISNLEPK
jgi:hypothetical protein